MKRWAKILGAVVFAIGLLAGTTTLGAHGWGYRGGYYHHQYWGWPWGFSFSYNYAPYYYDYGYAPYYSYYYPPPAIYRSQTPATTTSQTQYPTQPVSIADLKALAKAGLSDEIITSQIRNSHTIYHLTTAEIIDLKDSGVSEKVIDFMLNLPNR